MLKAAGIGYAVANSSEYCLMSADEIIGPNHEDSVAYEIESIIDLKKG